MLLRAASGEDVGAAAAARRGRGGEQASGVPQQRGRDAGDGLRAFWPPGVDHWQDLAEAGRTCRQKRGVEQRLVDDHVQEPQQQRQVRARRGLEVDAAAVVGEQRGRRPPRVDDEQAAGGPGGGQVCDGGRHRLGDVAADEQHRLGAAEIRERERQSAVHPERAESGGGRRGHAEAAVVVDVRRAQHDPGELAQGVGLFVGQAAAAEDRDRLRPVLCLQIEDPLRDEVERGLPSGRAQLTVRRARAEW